jgi:glutamyl-tRNA reductase
VERRVRENISVRKSEVVRAEAIIEEEIAELQDILRRRKQYLKRAV